MTGDACVALAGIRFRCHLIKDSHFDARSDWNGRSGVVTRSADNDTNVRLGGVQRRHLRHVDVTGGAAEIVIIGFRFTVSGKTMSIVAELK